MAEFNTNGGLEVSPGPRGYSVVDAETSPDGTVLYLKTDQPATLNGIPLVPGPRGQRGEIGDPGEARLRIDTTVGYRVFLWDTATAGENMIYGDTGVWNVGSGVLAHRHGNIVTTTATNPTTLPLGFRPSVGGSAAGKSYASTDPWPAFVTGTITTPPVTNRGLEGYEAATSQGFTGTAQEWIDMVYGVLPTNGVTGQYLGWNSSGPAWMGLPRIGPGQWVNITLTQDWKASPGQSPQVRLNNGTVELIGDVTYTGPSRTVGVWGTDFTKIGTLPPAYAPDAHYDYPVRAFKGLVGSLNYPVVARVDIDIEGQIYLGAFENNGVLTLPIRATHTSINLGALPSYPLRNSSLGG